MKPCDMTAVIDRKRYSTRIARLLTDDAYWDGHNLERHGRNTFLYRSPGGSYFALHMTCWQGEKDHIEPLTQDAAIELYERLHQSDGEAVPFEEAFPGVEVVEA